MGADFAAALVIAPADGITVDETALRSWLSQALESVTYGALYEASENGLHGSLYEILDERDEEEPGEELLSGADKDTVAIESMSIVQGLRDALMSRETGVYQVTESYFLYVSGGMSWGDSPSDAAEAIWQFGTLTTLLPGISDLLDVHFMGIGGPCTMLSTPLPVVAAALATSTDPAVRLQAVQDKFLPLTAAQLETLAHDNEEAVSEAAARRVAMSLTATPARRT